MIYVYLNIFKQYIMIYYLYFIINNINYIYFLASVERVYPYKKNNNTELMKYVKKTSITLISKLLDRSMIDKKK